MNNLVLVATVCGLLQFLSFSEFGYTFSEKITSAVVIGTIVGLMMGDPKTGLLIGAQIELLYIGMIYPGGIVPADGGLAAVVAIPIAIKTGLDPKAAVSLGIPFGIIGGLLYELKKTINIFGLHKLEDMINKSGDPKTIRKYQDVFPVLVAFLLSFPLVFLSVYFGPSVVGAIISDIPQWIMHGMEVAGGILPALGFAIAVSVIMKRKYMPLFFAGFFLVEYFKITPMGASIFGACIAVYLFMNNKSSKKGKKEEQTN
ncbi:PTS sugar transporter subunit IIC [Lactobacillus sp. ESL0791]|uniref:PTS mannose/fructose/sorbose/N-acetylgalactosamine transporter subunit IIC n=1 Tax=Lactobacillus sp. ESL0791 TaxID=2983234 RepID=UPI0023F78A76|nr:PTS sugar transporter subunit IIC [Lactobacillus sp. ESL0791]MDF7639647.1 PTS sugar transporter subunit IIC [Lactobacillus sp. ESL0791]